MKVLHNTQPNPTVASHHWVATFCMVLGFGVLAIAAFWIRKCKMFNLYQNINKKDDKEEKESNVIGHDRFCQERPSRSSSRKKKRPPRRAHSAAELCSATLTAANKRAAFSSRSHSSEQKDDKEGQSTPQRSDSLAKMIFNRGGRSSSVQKHEYSALRADGGSSEKHRLEKQVRDGAFSACRHYLATSDRYEFRNQLNDIGSRADKHWFIVQDISLGAERLLTLLPLPATCPLQPTEATRETILALFRALQHPYIHPVLDIQFWDGQAALISPLNQAGSLRDRIYGCAWHDDWERKYSNRGEALPLWQVQRLGRQILEALLFLRDRCFPPFYHLHSGNVILQNGVARLAGLENPLLGLLPRPPSAPDTLGFGHLLFEISAGYELPTPPSPAHLQLELERVPRVADVLHLIFQSNKQPTIEELLCCDLFRGVELRELRGLMSAQTRCTSQVLELLETVKRDITPSPLKRRDVVSVVEEKRRLEDIIEEDADDLNETSNFFVSIER